MVCTTHSKRLRTFVGPNASLRTTRNQGVGGDRFKRLLTFRAGVRSPGGAPKGIPEGEGPAMDWVGFGKGREAPKPRRKETGQPGGGRGGRRQTMGWTEEKSAEVTTDAKTL